MKCFCALAFACAVSAIAAAPARLKLADGSLLEGELSIDPNVGFVLTNADLGTTNVAVRAVRAAWFNSLPATSSLEVSSNSGRAFPPGWTNQDIGAVAISGSAKAETGVVTISSTGNRIWMGVPDQFHFMYRPFSGGGQIIAQVTNMEAAIAGVMFRKTLLPDSEFVMEGATLANDGLIFRTRRDPRHRELTRVEGDWHNRDEIKPPCWLRLARRDKRFTAYESLDDGITWQPIYESPNEWERTIYAGLFVVGGDSNSLKSATFTNILVEDEIETMSNSTNKAFTVQILLNDGSMLNADGISADETKIKIAFGQTNYSASVYMVARLLYRSIPDRLTRELTPHRKGVLLKSGDFFEGDIRSVDKYQVKLSSILFGSRSFPMDRVMAVIVSQSAEASGPYRVRTQDGSVIRAKTVAAGANSIIADEPRLGRMTIPLARLTQIDLGQKEEK